MALHLRDIDRVTLIRVDDVEEECTAALFRRWLDMCPGNPLDEAARTVEALCDAIRQIRNDYQYEFGRAEHMSNQLVALSLKVAALESPQSVPAVESVVEKGH